MHYIVYLTKNLLNNKQYIGIHQTKNLDDGYLGSGKHLKNAIKKYGAENFKREILFKADTYEELLAKEAELVNEEYCDRDDTYNICVGGFGGGFKHINRFGLQLTEKRLEASKRTIKLAAARHKELQSNAEWKAAQSEKISKGLLSSEKFKTCKRAPMSDAHKAAISRTNSRKLSGQGNSQFGTIWITDGDTNKKIKRSDPIPENFRPGRIKNVDKLVRVH